MAVDKISNTSSVYGLTGDTVGRKAEHVYSDFLPGCYTREYFTV